ncbi:MAG TPA: AMP-binding protein [Acidimicrobiales bacterium]|nr:AMP-binding protein [Acidimicrobiales bacterium]
MTRSDEMTADAHRGELDPRVDMLHTVTLADVLRQHRANRPGHTAVVCGQDRHDFSSLDERVNRLANALSVSGVGSGDRILWLGQNCHRLLEGLLAAAKLGAVFCPANWRQSADEFAFVLEDSNPAVVIWQEAEIGDVLREARASSRSTALWVRHDGEGEDSYEQLLASGAPDDPARPVSESESVLMMYTAAFGGSPNGALLPHLALVLQGTVMAQLQWIGPDYVYLNCGPLFHVATFMTTLATFVSGGTNVFTPRVDAEELCRLISEERCTGAFVMPPTMDQIVDLNSDGRFDLKSLRAFGGKPQWTAMITVDESPWGIRPAGYGQTEVMGLATFNALGPSIGRAGRPVPFVRVCVADPESRLLPPGEVGEIVVRGPTVMNGYHNRPELNAERQKGGWHHTNDLGRVEADGSLTFVGPKTRLIKSAAENIYPTEVEGCLKLHDDIADAAVIGVPDPTWGQNVVAVVVRRDGAEVSEEAIIDHCRKHIASYKKPKRVEFVDALPRKGWAVDYDALDETFGGGGYPGTGR